MSQPNSSTTTAPSMMNSPSLVYNNLPPDHILNKQRSNISIKQINKIPNSSTTNSTSTNGNGSTPPASSSSIHNNVPTLNNPLTSILNSSNNNSIIMLSNNNNNNTNTQQQQLNTNNTLSNNNNNNQMVIGGSGDLIMPPPTVSSSTNSNHSVMHSNNISNNLAQDVILTNRTQFLLDSSSISNNSDVLFNIRIGNPKQIEMEITKSGNEIKYYNRSCIHDLDSLQRYWSECYRIESEHANDKPLMYIPITGVINIKLFKNLENPNLEHHLEKKYDFRQSDSLIIPIKFENNIVMVLKLMKMDYVEFIGLQAIDFYLIKQITTNTLLQQQP